MTSTTPEGRALITTIKALSREDLELYAIAQAELAEVMRTRFLRDDTFLTMENKRGFNEEACQRMQEISFKVSQEVNHFLDIYKTLEKALT